MRPSDATLHLHRSPTTAAAVEAMTPRALAIAQRVFSAFGVATEVFADLDVPTVGVIFQAPPKPDGRRPVAKRLRFPGPDGQSHQYTDDDSRVNPDWFIHHIAAAETAIRWKHAGLIDHHCDLYRWNRTSTGNETQDKLVKGALQLLGNSTQEEQTPTRHSTPHRGAVKTARKLLQALNRRQPVRARWTALLIGSKARGNHLPSSDTDILIWQLGQSTNSRLKRAGRIVSQFSSSAAKCDIAIVEQWTNPIWSHHSNRPDAPNPPNAVAFAHDTQDLTRLPISTDSKMQHPRAGVPCHILTTGCQTVKPVSANYNSWGTYEHLDQYGCR